MRNVTKIPTAAESAPHNKATHGIDDDGDNSHAPAPAGSVRAKTAWFLTSIAASCLLLFLLRNEFHGPKPSESSQAQPQVQSKLNSQSSRFPISSVASSLRKSPASVADMAQPRDVNASEKRPESDESPLRRWQLGTHWGKEPDPALGSFSSWAQRYLAADPADRDTMVAQGVELAQHRRAALLELIATDPREALASSVPFSVRQELPADITAQLEQRVSGKGDFLVLATVPREDAPGDHPGILRRALIGQERFTAHVFGERKNQRTTTDISLHGVALDGQLALSESPVRLLEPGEPPVSGAKNAEPICSVSGLGPGTVVAGGPVLAASGSQVHWLCRGGHLEALEHQVRAAEGGSVQGGVAAYANATTGPRKILAIMVDFSDVPGGALSQTDAQANLNDVTAFIRSNAYNQIEFTVKDVTQVLRMPRTAAFYVNNSNDPANGSAYDLLQDARAAATSAGFSSNNYDFDVVAFANIGFPWGGLGFVGAKGSWVQGNFHRGVTAHELGHNFGNWHANAWISSTVIGTNGTHQEYGNPFDVLGNAGNYPRSHHSANFKFLNGWLPNAYIHTVTANGTYRIHAQDFGGNLDPARKYAIRIPVAISAGGETMDYWLDFRPGYTGDSATANGAVLKWGNDFGTQSASRLLDTQPDTLGYMEDAPLLVGRTFNDPARSLSITTLAKGGSGTDTYLDIQISVGSSPRVTLGEALDLADAVWTTGGDQSWAGQTAVAYDGQDAAVSGGIDHNQQSFVETTVTGPGTLTFWWRVSSERGYDYLSFLSDGLVIDSISGEQTWQQRTNFVSAGSHTFRWRYSKDGSVAAGSDRGWLDVVSFTPSPLTPPTGLTPGSPTPDGSVTVNSSPLSLSWNAAAGADRYEVLSYHWDWTGGNWVYDATLTTTANSVAYQPPVDKTHYAWTVRAGRASLSSGWANWAFFYADVPCNYTLSSSRARVPGAGGVGSVSVSAMPGCGWAAQSNADWITITAGSTGNGNGVVTYSVDAYSGKKSRTGTLTIAGQIFSVTQTYK